MSIAAFIFEAGEYSLFSLNVNAGASGDLQLCLIVLQLGSQPAAHFHGVKATYTNDGVISRLHAGKAITVQ